MKTEFFLIFLYKYFNFVHNDLGDDMKKVIIITFAIIGIMMIIPKNQEMIRVRVLANSNDEYDQNVKKEVVEIVSKEFKDIMSDVSDIEEARSAIDKNLDTLSTKIDNYLLANNVNYGYDINFGLNYFPPKELNGNSYDEGYYESVLVTLGEGAGDNWWCILFPSICLTDENANYESMIKNIFKKIFY